MATSTSLLVDALYTGLAGVYRGDEQKEGEEEMVGGEVGKEGMVVGGEEGGLTVQRPHPLQQPLRPPPRPRPFELLARLRPRALVRPRPLLAPSSLPLHLLPPHHFEYTALKPGMSARCATTPSLFGSPLFTMV